jgi:hypothetical protein
MAVLGSAAGDIPELAAKIDFICGQSGNFTNPLACDETELNHLRYGIGPQFW